MFEKMKAELGTIDILINNAGLQKDAPLDEMTLDQWNLVINVNLTGQFLCAREAVREFKRRGVVPEVSCAAGKIICMSSVHEVIPWAGHVNIQGIGIRRSIPTGCCQHPARYRHLLFVYIYIHKCQTGHSDRRSALQRSVRPRHHTSPSPHHPLMVNASSQTIYSARLD